MARRQLSRRCILTGMLVVTMALAASWCPAAPWPSRESAERVTPTPSPQRNWLLDGTIGIWFDAAGTVDTLRTSASAETVTAWVVLDTELGNSAGKLGGWEAAIAVEGEGVTDLGWTPLRGVNLARSPRLRVSLHWDEAAWNDSRPVVARGRLVVSDPGATVRIYVRPCTPSSLASPTLEAYDYPSEQFAPAPCVWPASYTGDYHVDRPLPLGPVSGSVALPVAVINPVSAAPLLSVAPDTLDFGDVAAGVARERRLVLANVGGGTLTGEIPAPACAEFALVGPGGGFALAPGETLGVRYRFQPSAGGTYACATAAGADIVLTGTATAAGSCGFTPARLEFGPVPNEHGLFRASVFTNATADSADLDLWQTTFPGWVGGLDWLRVPPGASIGVPILYQPYQLSALDDSLGVAGCGRVRLHGDAVPAPPACSISGLDGGDFGSVAAGFQKSATVRIRNAGDGILAGEAAIAGDGFTILAGGEPFALAWDESHPITVAYSPAHPDTDRGLLTFGADACESLPLRGFTSHCVASATELDFGTVPVGGTRTLSFQVSNLGPVVVVGRQAADCPHVIIDNTSFWISAGRFANVAVRYHPVSAGDHVCTVSLGPGIGLSVTVRGSGVDLPPVCSLLPATLDFGQVAQARSGYATLRITNTGGGEVTGDARVEGDGFTITKNGGPFSLPPGALRDVSIMFYASAPGLWTGRFLATGQCAEVPLRATVPTCAVLPDSLDFGAVELGCQSQRWLVVRNPGPVELQECLFTAGCDAAINPSGGYFQIPAGGEATRLVTFAPQTVGALACTLRTSLACRVAVVCRGVGLPPVPLCSLSTDTLDFGRVVVGQERNLTFSFTNGGCSALAGAVPPVDAPFRIRVGLGAYELAHGAARAVTVTFAPAAAGLALATLDLGDACGPVVLVGSGVAAEGAPDMIGIYFAPGDAQRELHTTQPYEPVTAHLILASPSQATGISGWECCVEIVGGALGTAWELPAGALNVGTSPCFQVGLQEPWLWGPSLVLATVRFLQESPLEETLLYIHPYSRPSLPGTPLYAAGHDPGLLVPMFPVSGSEAVAVAAVNPVQLVPVLAPRPEVACEGGVVRLSWTYDPGSAQGCRLYRRVGEAPAVGLPGAPLTDPQGRISTCDPAVAASGSPPVYYSYALLRDGEEFARSAETVTACAAAPPAATALRPLFPNPFNPQVNVSFDLARPGRVRLAVFDVAGRRVRTLEDGDLAAATHTRTWDGRDDAGRPLPSGTYYARLTADGVAQLRKMSLVR